MRSRAYSYFFIQFPLIFHIIFTITSPTGQFFEGKSKLLLDFDLHFNSFLFSTSLSRDVIPTEDVFGRTPPSGAYLSSFEQKLDFLKRNKNLHFEFVFSTIKSFHSFFRVQDFPMILLLAY